MEALWISNTVLWVAVLLLGALVLVLSRQVGILHERIAPVGALDLGKGPRVGEAAPEMKLESIGGDVVSIGGQSASNRNTLLFFLSPTCPVCDQLIPAIRSLSASEAGHLDVVFASDGEPARQRAFYREKDLEDFPYVLSTQLGVAFEVGRLPHAVLIDAAGIVRGQGLVNTREHLESLLEAMERGVGSIQDFMRQADDSHSSEHHLDVA